jgi:hypothetical protein
VLPRNVFLFFFTGVTIARAGKDVSGIRFIMIYAHRFGRSVHTLLHCSLRHPSLNESWTQLSYQLGRNLRAQTLFQHPEHLLQSGKRVLTQVHA